MDGLRISAFFWYLDAQVTDEVLGILKGGNFHLDFSHLKEREDLRNGLIHDPPDLVVADFDIPIHLRQMIEEEMAPFMSEVPLIYLVGEKNVRQVADTLKSGIWDFVQKDQFFKLVPSVYSALKYSKVIKEREEAERALKESRDRYASIFNCVTDGIVLMDSQTRKIMDCNPRFLEIFGFKKKDIHDLDAALYSAADEGYTMERVRKYIDQAAQSGKPVTFEWRNIHNSGEKIWTLNSISLVKIDEKDQILLVTRNIDEQKQLEQSLLASQEHFRALAENSPDVIMRFDREHRHLYVNSAVVEQLGLAQEEFKGKTHAEMGIFPAHLVKLWEDSLDRVFTSGKPHTIEFEVELNDRKICYEWRLYPEIGSSEAIQSVIGVARDITRSKRSQEALTQSEERLNLALTATNLGLWDWNLVTNQVYYSPIWFSMLGYEENELAHEFDTWTTLLHPDDKDQSVSHVQKAIASQNVTFEFEFRLRRKDGNYNWIRSMGKAVDFDDHGKTTRFTGIHQDIHAKKREEEIKQVLIEISNAVSSTHSLDELYSLIRLSLGRVVDTTNCFLALYHEDSDTLTLPFMEDEKDAFTEFPARKTLTSYVIKTGEAQLVDVEREKELTKLGEIEPVGAPCVSWLGVPLRHEGKTIGVFAVQSYTEDAVYTEEDAELLEFASDQIALAIDRRRHQDRLRSNQERQRRVFESSPDPMMVVDPQGLILDFNSAFVEVLGVDPKLVYGQKIFGFIQRDHWRASIKDFHKTWDQGYLKNLEYQVVRPDGKTFDAEVSSGAIYASDGKPESMVLIIKDISERKEVERKILEAKYKAEESDKLKTAFLSNMSHEIRTPMNAIVGFSDLLLDEQLTPQERRDFIAQINQGADDLMRLIDDIIDIAKIEAGQVNVHIAECFIRDLYKELHLMFIQNIRRSGKEEVNLRLQWDWPLNELAIYTDPFRLKQILINLLSNAVKFTEKGDIVLGLKEHPDGIYFYVRDSGIGIREDKQKVIFDRFMQGHETKTKLYGGTGLGLAISKNLTEILGGMIGVESKSGEGSTFWFILPRNEVPLKYEAALRAPARDLKSWEGKKILIAEDDHSNYYFLFEALKDTGVEILWSKDGEETLEIFRANKDLDLVLMDINMPLLNGYECTKVIKKEQPDLPVIAQTAYAMSGEREISREAGCDDYLAKPIKVSELLDTLAMHL
jgi:PAS domain S-box-containing protein